jgi:hypothetical protein
MKSFKKWLIAFNVKHKIVQRWWRYDDKGTPHIIGLRFFEKYCVKFSNVK